MTNNLPEFDELKNIRTTLREMLASGTPDTSDTQRGYVPRKRLEDTIFELITMGYVYGITVAGLDLETDLPVDAERMREVADTPTKGETFRQRITNHIEAYERRETDEEQLIERIAVVAETETHRAINDGELDAGFEYERTHPNEVLFKRWRTMMDDRVRDTHDSLEGATVPLNARFYTFDGDSALKPGGFMLPENNVNCRCDIQLIKA